MYVSDYGYAASPENWRRNLEDYDLATNTNNNWLYLGDSEWTITPTTVEYGVFSVNRSGNLSRGTSVSSISVSARPSLYLKSNVNISDGMGTSSDPYRLAI